MAFFLLAGEISQDKEAIPWVRCASGNVSYSALLFKLGHKRGHNCQLRNSMHSAAAVFFLILSLHTSNCDEYNHQSCATTEAGKYSGAMSKPVPKIVGDAIKATYAPFQVGLMSVNIDENT